MAAAITKSDVSAKTSLTKGYAGVNGDSASRTFVVTGLDVDNQDNADAIALVKTDIGDYHHSITNLPVRAMTSSKFGPDRAMVTAAYGRTGISIPSVHAYKLASKRTGLRNFKYYASSNKLDSNGRPNGDLTGWETVSTLSNSAHSWPCPSRMIAVPTVIDDDPSDTLTQYIGCVNNAAINLSEIFSNTSSSSSSSEPDQGDETFAQYTVKFQGIDVEPVDLGGVVIYRVRYLFEHIPSPGWVEQNVDYATHGITLPPVLSSVTNVVTNTRISTVLVARGWIDMTAMCPVHTPVH